ncbi:MAG: GNAT family N-acetyltransferase [Gemmatimonadales bacterium]
MDSAIETEDLHLFPQRPECILALIEDPERYESLVGFPAAPGLREFFVSDEVSSEWLASLRTPADADPWRFGFAVVHRESRAVVGSGGFKGPPDAEGMVEIAYGIVPTFQLRGFATQVAAALTAHAMENDSVRIVRAHTMPEPNPSNSVLKKCGFSNMGEVVDPDDGLVWRWEKVVSP